MMKMPRNMRKRKVCKLGFEWCSHCKQVLPSDRFGTEKGRWNGKQGTCKKCRRYFYRKTVSQSVLEELMNK